MGMKDRLEADAEALTILGTICGFVSLVAGGELRQVARAGAVAAFAAAKERLDLVEQLGDQVEELDPDWPELEQRPRRRLH